MMVIDNSFFLVEALKSVGHHAAYSYVMGHGKK
jgi:hypothetical protein